jgi:hypothetical protein
MRARMSDESKLAGKAGADALAYVCWRGGDGARVAGCPLERSHAEALARAYAQFFPRQDYWVEPVPWLDISPMGRPRRHSH